MSAGETVVRLVLDTGDGDEERAEEEIRYLRTEVEELGVERVERVVLGPTERSGRARSAKALREEERAFSEAVRRGSKSALSGITDAMYSGRQWSVTADTAAGEQAAALMRSARWAALRASAPVAWRSPTEPEGRDSADA